MDSGVLSSVLSSAGILASESEHRGRLDFLDCTFGIRGGKLSHTSSILSKWLMVDCVRVCVQLEIEEKKGLLACM